MLRNKIRKVHKTAGDYKARNIGVLSFSFAIASCGVLLPIANQYKEENIELNHKIELLMNDDVQEVVTVKEYLEY